MGEATKDDPNQLDEDNSQEQVTMDEESSTLVFEKEGKIQTEDQKEIKVNKQEDDIDEAPNLTQSKTEALEDESRDSVVEHNPQEQSTKVEVLNMDKSKIKVPKEEEFSEIIDKTVEKEETDGQTKEETDDQTKKE